jgi:hypothetical protein
MTGWLRPFLRTHGTGSAGSETYFIWMLNVSLGIAR